MDTPLKSTPVSRCLENRLMMFGFEAIDLLAILLLLSVLNLLFGRLGMRLLLVVLPSTLFGLILRIGKRGKPDGFLLHWLRYQFQPGVYSAFPDASQSAPCPSTRERRSRR